MNDVSIKVRKARWSIAPWEAIAHVVEVFEFGARKYEARGWETVPDAVTVYQNAAQRHLAAMFMGEIRDRESGLLHAAHLACCALVIAWHQLRTPPRPEPFDPHGTGGNLDG